MFITQTAEYGLRAMAQLALSRSPDLIKAEILAGETGIPRHYISKIMRRLVEHDLIVAQKGHGGGFRLARAPGRIRYIDILGALGYEPGSEHCVFGWPECGNDNPCPLHDSWTSMNDAFQRWLYETTLAEVDKGGDPLLSAPLRPAAAKGSAAPPSVRRR